jgi:hypothetical protein
VSTKWGEPQRDEAAEWLIDYLSANGGQAERKDLLKLVVVDVSSSGLRPQR